MANTDSSSYSLRWNEMQQRLEYASGGNWYVTPTSGGSTTPNIVQIDYSGSQTFTGPDLTNFHSLTPAFAVTITPSSTTAKIKLSGSLFMQGDLTGGTNTPTGRLSVWRDGTNLCPNTWISSIDFWPSSAGNGTTSVQVPINWLDTPGDTNPHTYEIKVTAATAGSSIVFVGASLDNLLIAEEVH